MNRDRAPRRASTGHVERICRSGFRAANGLSPGRVPRRASTGHVERIRRSGSRAANGLSLVPVPRRAYAGAVERICRSGSRAANGLNPGLVPGCSANVFPKRCKRPSAHQSGALLAYFALYWCINSWGFLAIPNKNNDLSEAPFWHVKCNTKATGPATAGRFYAK